MLALLNPSYKLDKPVRTLDLAAAHHQGVYTYTPVAGAITTDEQLHPQHTRVRASYNNHPKDIY
jgi:hypothetical protein